MSKKMQSIYIGETPLKQPKQEVLGDYIDLLGEPFYRIQNFDQMPPFFMSLVSSTNQWLFISSTGGLTAGRMDPENALFPYYTEDKLTENGENTGAKAIFMVQQDAKTWLWEPFSIRQEGHYDIQRNIYKNVTGTILIFEEINFSLGLFYRYAWRTSDRFGFIKTSWLHNTGDTCRVGVLDGIQNILPAFTLLDIQNTSSCLLDAYKRVELDPETGLAIFALNATLTDLPEPSESLLATTVFQIGLEKGDYLLSSTQLDDFRKGEGIRPEFETRGRRGAFFVRTQLELQPEAITSWHIAADVSQDWAQIVKTKMLLSENRNTLADEIEADIADNKAQLREIVASADGLQLSADKTSTRHHFSNVLFNVMRGGIFYDQYWLEKDDFIYFISNHNKQLLVDQADFFSTLPDKINISELHQLAEICGDANLIRLSSTYLPLYFSRRHGDPSRPWNTFSINIKNEDGSKKLDYEGNWRDIFQNWEALAWSYPEFVAGMIDTFLNATTADGYNPYRITLGGIDWEVPEPGNPWSNIGYWSDHQIIYLLKLLALNDKVHPDALKRRLGQSIFSYANVPYRIKPFEAIVADPYHTILFDPELNAEIEESAKDFGSDAKLIRDSQGNVIHRNLLEKLLMLLLTKLVNFVPDGGIWMNTQRPEWNDANNALVGKGLSVVTLGYLYRFISFLQRLLVDERDKNFQVSSELADLFTAIVIILEKFQPFLEEGFDERARFEILSRLGKAGSHYREGFYQSGFSGAFSTILGSDLLEFLDLVKGYFAHSLRANRREDNLYHAYNVMQLDGKTAVVKHLDLMLEGQVSILSSGILSGEEALTLLQGLRQSSLYLPEQKTYILYPDKSLPGFLEKNKITPEQVSDLRLLDMLDANQDKSLLVKDALGNYHFSGMIHNERDVWAALEKLEEQPQYQKVVQVEAKRIARLFEATFRHDEFTGRSSTFFAYEGLGSIYWHMVAKLLLAVQENILGCSDKKVAYALLQKYREIRSGLGFNKKPEAFGAFPTDPYSHTPRGQGARQPGMTGLVKEEILARLGELGLTVEDGCLIFDPFMIDESEMLAEPTNFEYIDVIGRKKRVVIPSDGLAYTFCQTPILLQAGDAPEIEVHFEDGKGMTIPGNKLDQDISRHIFQRDGEVQRVVVQFVRE